MPDYRRNRVPGGTCFFTVNLLERNSRLLTGHIDELRAAVGKVRRSRPFHIDGWVVLPEHMHCVWTLPEGDADYAARWKAIKIAFANPCPAPSGDPLCVSPRANGESGSVATGNTRYATSGTGMGKKWGGFNESIISILCYFENDCADRIVPFAAPEGWIVSVD